MWMLLSVANYRLTCNPKSRVRGLIAANHLAAGSILMEDLSRLNSKEREGWSIIDTLMNLPYCIGQPKKQDTPATAKLHRLMQIKLQKMLCDDGSVTHIVEYDCRRGK